MDFRVRTAGTAADLPEVIFQTNNTFIRDAYDIVPDMIGFVIFGINGDPKLIRRQFQLFGQKFPSPGNDFLFEIIAKREVAQHFKISMVTSCAADVFNIVRTNTFLAGRNARRRRFHLPCKKRFERCHSSPNQQQGRIIMRNERGTGKNQMTVCLEKIQIFLTDFITS